MHARGENVRPSDKTNMRIYVLTLLVWVCVHRASWTCIIKSINMSMSFNLYTSNLEFSESKRKKTLYVENGKAVCLLVIENIFQFLGYNHSQYGLPFIYISKYLFTGTPSSWQLTRQLK